MFPGDQYQLTKNNKCIIYLIMIYENGLHRILNKLVTLSMKVVVMSYELMNYEHIQNTFETLSLFMNNHYTL